MADELRGENQSVGESDDNFEPPRGYQMTPAWKMQGLEEAQDKPRAKKHKVLVTH